MLVDEKLRPHRRALGICTKLGFLPFHLENEGRYMVLNIPKFHKIVWIGLLSVSIVYAGYINVRLLETLIRNQKTEFSDLGVHISRCVISIVMSFWAYDGFAAHGGERAIIYNYTNAPVDRAKRRKQDKSLHSCVQDHMVLNSPRMIYPVPFYFVGFFLWQTHSAQFLYAVLPQGWQTLATLMLCSLFELIVTLFWMAQAHLFVSDSMMFQQKLEMLLTNELHFQAECPLEDLKQKVMMMREVQTAVGIHSVGQRRSVFAQKVICISLGIVGLYFFIRLMGAMLAVSFMFLVIGFNCVSFYSVIWDKAHMIPTLMENLRREVLRRLPNRRSSESTTYLKLRLKSVPACAIQVGSFRLMERNSTLLFTDFVVGNLAALLISF